MYYYYLTINGFETEISPLVTSPIINYHKTKDYMRDFVPQYRSKLTFNKKKDFELLRSFETTQNQCKQIPLTIKKDCGSDKIVFGSGYISLLNGDWDLDRCVVDLPISITDKYYFYNSNADKDINLFEAVLVNNRITVNYTLGTIEKKSFTAPTGEEQYTSKFFGYDPRDKGWILYRFELLVNSYNVGFNYFYARETLNKPSATVMSADWILIIDNTSVDNTKTWARSAILNNYTKLYLNNQLPANGVTVRTKVQLFTTDILGDSGFSGKFDNGMKLGDVLSYFITKFATLTIRSDFFQINPINISNINYVTGLRSTVDNIIVFQKSDVKRPNSSDNATILKFKLEKLIVGLCKAFNLGYRINNGVFELEHVSFFARQTSLDLTIPKYSKWMNYKNRYTYKIELIAKYEELKMQEAGNPDFIGYPIEYIGSCTTEDESQQRKTITAEEITTDVLYCLNNSDSDNNDVDDQGICLVATYLDANRYYMLQESPIIDKIAKPNNALSVAQLQQKFWMHERLLTAGIMNNNAVNFITAIPIKKGVKVSIPICCTDVITLGNYFKTKLGLGIVETAAHDIAKDILDLDLLYEGVVGGSGIGGGGGGSTVVCLRPKIFVVNSHLNPATINSPASFYFNLEFFDNIKLYDTQLEVTFPSGLIKIYTVLNENGSTFNRWDSPIPAETGTYKFRKRLKCIDGTWSNYTEFTQADVVAFAPVGACNNLPEPISYQGRVNQNEVIFEVSTSIVQAIEVEYRHKWLVFWTNWKSTTVILQTSNGGVTTVIVKLFDNFKMKKGRWQFRLRKRCSGSTTSDWSNSIEFKI